MKKSIPARGLILLVASLACGLGAVRGAERASSHYAMAHEAIDSGGQRVTSAHYLIYGEAGGIGGLGQSASGATPLQLRAGFPAQINDAPDALTQAASGAASFSAVLRGTVNPQSLDTRAWFEWGTSDAYGQTTATQDLGGGSSVVEISFSLQGLAEGATLHFRAVAENADGLVRGADFTFITDQNLPPVAVADGFTGTESAVLTVPAPGVLANDTDANLPNDALTVDTTPVSNPAHGSVILNADGAFSYTHDGSENFTDSFVYRVRDAANHTSTATVNLTITPVNDNSPVGVNDSATVAEGGTVTLLTGAVTSVLANDTDVDLPNDTLTVDTTPVSGPAHGSVTLNADGTFSYTHDGSENFTDSFVYRVRDAANHTATVTVTINVTALPCEAPPFAFADNLQAYKNTPSLIDVLANDGPGCPGTTILITKITGTPDSGVAEILPDGSAILYTPFWDNAGGDQFGYTITDNLGRTATSTVNIDVINHPPVANAITVNVHVGDTDVELLTPTTFFDLDSYSTLIFNPDLSGLTHGAATPSVATLQNTIQYLGADQVWTENIWSLLYTATSVGTDVIPYKLSDLISTDTNVVYWATFSTITVNVLPVNNNPPVLAAIGDKDASEGVLLTFTATATDIDLPPQSLTFSLDAGFPTGASITSAGVFTWTPTTAQAPGIYPVTVRVKDSGAPQLEDFETFNITVCADHITVQNNNDAGAGSLRQALLDICPGGTITFDSGLTGTTIALTSGTLVVNKMVTITGLGADKLTVSGENHFAVFDISAAPSVTISGLTIANGDTDDEGGGIYSDVVAAPVLVLTDCAIENNHADVAGGGVYLNAGTLSVERCTFSGNSTAGSGGAIWLGSSTTAVLINCTISGNSAGTTPTSFGGGIYQGTLTISSSSLTLWSCTIVDNSATKGSGVYTDGSLFVKNTILALNAPSTTDLFFIGSSSSSSFNRFGGIDPTSGPFAIGANSASGVSASALNLGSLADNGGSTKTHALLLSPTVSTAIDQGDSTATGSGTLLDQRGESRPFDVTTVTDGAGNKADIGALELHNSPPTITCPTAHEVECTSPAGTTVTVAVQVNDTDGDPLTVTWSEDGTTQNVPAGGPPTSASLTFSKSYTGLGAHTITVTVNDGQTPPVSCNTTITIIDTAQPTVDCPSVPAQTAFANASCQAQVPDVRGLVRAVSSDNCTAQANLVITQVPAENTTVNGAGASDITVTVCDTATPTANCRSCVVPFTVIDNIRPTITAPSNVTAYTGPGATVCGKVVSDATLGTATFGDNCPGSTVGRTGVPAGNLFPVGPTTLTYTATDAHGNTKSSTQTVTVIDTTPPTVACAQVAAQQALTDSLCHAVVPDVRTLVRLKSSDNCTVAGSLIITQVPGFGSTVTGAGHHDIIVTVCDNATPTPNCTTCVVPFVVIDNLAPTVSTATASPPALWPPNHTMRDVTINYTTADTCGPVTCVLSVTSNEPVTGTGDGDLAPDWVVIDPHHVQLRAERSGSGNGRVYAITVTCTDASNNSISTTTTVKVDHAITGPKSGAAFKIGTPITFTGRFWDVPGSRHSAQWFFDSLTGPGTVVEPTATKPGAVTGTYVLNDPGVYGVRLKVTDSFGAYDTVDNIGDLDAIVVVYDPNGGYVTGGGWITSPPGALVANPSLTGSADFGFVSKYFKSATNPKGETQFGLKLAGFKFNALNFDYLVVSGPMAQFKGFGKVNDTSGYNFILTVIDGQQPKGGGYDKLRLKIWNKTSGQVIYDTQPGAPDNADPTTNVGDGSSIVIQPK